MTNKRRRHTPDQIIRKLAEGHELLASGNDLDGDHQKPAGDGRK
jgi:putative transposase